MRWSPSHRRKTASAAAGDVAPCDPEACGNHEREQEQEVRARPRGRDRGAAARPEALRPGARLTAARAACPARAAARGRALCGLRCLTVAPCAVLGLARHGGAGHGGRGSEAVLRADRRDRPACAAGTTRAAGTTSAAGTTRAARA